MSDTYPWGYGSTRLTLEEMESKTSWNRIHPEMRRRISAMMKDAKKVGVDLGLGTGYRSSAQQRSLFLSRYIEDPNGSTSCDGKKWTKKPGVATAACPGRSYHEETDSAGFCFAADMVGNLDWMNKNCERYGLIHFANVNDEPWHIQPAELPRGRSQYKGQTLSVFPLPGSPTSPAPTTHPEGPATTSSSKHPYPGKPIKIDSRGEAVKLVQAKVGATPDGWVGPVTQRLIMKWQRDRKLKADGVVGLVTWKAMFG